MWGKPIMENNRYLLLKSSLQPIGMAVYFLHKNQRLEAFQAKVFTRSYLFDHFPLASGLFKPFSLVRGSPPLLTRSWTDLREVNPTLIFMLPLMGSSIGKLCVQSTMWFILFLFSMAPLESLRAPSSKRLWATRVQDTCLFLFGQTLANR